MVETVDVPSPVPPDDKDAWYAPAVRAQYEVESGIVVTIRERAEAFSYEVREPTLARPDRLARVESYFADASVQQPLTREGAAERIRAGLPPKWADALDRLVDCTPAARRRLGYRVLASTRCLGAVTPLALDGRVEMADNEGHGPDIDEGSVDVAGDRLIVHTENFAPAVTEISADVASIERFASERLARYTVSFHDFEVPVVLYRENVLGGDSFAVKYAVLEPDLLPGDELLVDRCKERVWEAGSDGVVENAAAHVRDRAEQLLTRELAARNASAWLDAARHRIRSALAEYDLALPPVDRRFAADRLDDLLYYVLRDFVGYGQLTVPILDSHLEDIEANRVGERVKVVPRDDLHDGRVPTNLVFDDETEFVDVVTQLAAEDGAELNASNPSAKVNLDPGIGIRSNSEEALRTAEETIRCAVALPTISEDGPHISIRKQAADPLTPVDLVEQNAMPTELVALLWLLYEHHGVVLFSGPTGVGKTTLMNAHMPFIHHDDRPVSIDEGSREVRLPHETGVSLTTREHEQEFKRVSMADLMTEANYLNPDTEVIAEINTPASFETFGESVNTGHGLIGTTHAEDIETLVNRVVEQGLPPYLLRELDLVVFPRRTDGDRYVGEVVELLTESEFSDLNRPPGTCGTVEKDGTQVYWNRIARRIRPGESPSGDSTQTPSGSDGQDGRFAFAYDHPVLGDETRDVRTKAFARLAEQTDRSVEAVEREFHRKHRYVEYFVREEIADFEELFAFLADLRTDEAATVERVGHREVSYADD